MKKLLLFTLIISASIISKAQSWDLGAGTHFMLYNSKLYDPQGPQVIETAGLRNAYTIGGGVHYPLKVIGDRMSINANGGLLLYGRLANGFLGAQIPAFVNIRFGSFATNHETEGFAFGLGAGACYNAFLFSDTYFADFPTFIKPIGKLEFGYNDWRLRFYATYGSHTKLLNDYPNDKSTATYRTMFGVSLLYSNPIDQWEK